MNDNDIKKLISAMKGTFATAEDHANLEEKVDIIAETTKELLKVSARLHQIPTKKELISAIQETYNLTKLKAEHEHIKTIIHEKLGVEVVA